jgi:hypothetical protein
MPTHRFSGLLWQMHSLIKLLYANWGQILEHTKEVSKAQLMQKNLFRARTLHRWQNLECLSGRVYWEGIVQYWSADSMGTVIFGLQFLPKYWCCMISSTWLCLSEAHWLYSIWGTVEHEPHRVLGRIKGGRRCLSSIRFFPLLMITTSVVARVNTLSLLSNRALLKPPFLPHTANSSLPYEYFSP